MTTSSNVKINTTSFDYNYHYSQKHGNSNMPEYVRHNIDVYNEVLGLSAVYQNAVSYYHGDYSLPCTDVELSVDGGTDPRLISINNLNRIEIEGMTDDEVTEFVDKIEWNEINNKTDIYRVFDLLKDNNNQAEKYADELEIEPVFQDNI